MTLLGPHIHDLKLKDIQNFVDAAEVEGLLWEAKGTDVHPGAVRKAVCAFANGRETGYLILGAVKGHEGWELPGFEVPGDDAPAWVTQVIAPALRPVPIVDVKSLPAAGGRQVVVVEVPPVAIPPCINRGTVWERVSGRTIAVEDPLRLSDLYTRGTNEKVRAEHAAATAATDVLSDPLVTADDNEAPRFALAVNSTGNPPDISSRLFSPAFEEELRRIAGEHLAHIAGPPPLNAQYIDGVEQSNRWLEIADPYAVHRLQRWHIRAIWDGTVVVRYGTVTDYVPPEQLVEFTIKPAWLTAAQLVSALGGYGPASMELRIDGGKALPGPTGQPMGVVKMGRRLLQAEPDDVAVASLKRELQRATGQRVYEEPS